MKKERNSKKKKKNSGIKIKKLIIKFYEKITKKKNPEFFLKKCKTKIEKYF